MKVFYVTMAFPFPSETFASNDVRTLWKKGVNISVHSLRPAHALTQELASERGLTDIPFSHSSRTAVIAGIRTAMFRPRLLLQLLCAIWRYCSGSAEHVAKSLALMPRVLHIFSEIENEAPDVVHIYWGHYPSLVGYLVQSNLPKTVVTISLVAYDIEMRYGIAKVVAQKADLVRTLANVNVGQLQAVYGVARSNIVVIPDGVDIDRFLRNCSSDNPRHSFEIGGQKIPQRIVTAGRLTRRKGVHDVLDVFSAVIKHYPAATLVYMGDGPERESLELRCSKLGIDHAVRFLGHVDQDRVFREMIRAELFLFLSTGSGERLPNVVKEAMIAECGCVVSCTTGIDELIRDERYGHVVPLADVQEATGQVLSLLGNPERRASIGRAAKALVIENFDLEKSTEQYIFHWKQLVNERAAKANQENVDVAHERYQPKAL